MSHCDAIVVAGLILHHIFRNRALSFSIVSSGRLQRAMPALFTTGSILWGTAIHAQQSNDGDVTEVTNSGNVRTPIVDRSTQPDSVDASNNTDVSESESPQPFLDTTIRLQPTVVTARKWEEFAQDVPQSVTVIGSETIEDAGITDIRDAALLAPNVHFTEFSSRRLSFPTIRGIGSGQGDPAVTTYIDGVPQLSVSSTNLPLLDVERIEFLRGPQGTLYGRNSIGGLIHIISKRPINTPTVRLSATLGNYDLQTYGIAYNGPLVKDKLFLSIAGQYSARDGYTKNVFNDNDVDDRESVFGRGSVLWMPTEDTEITFAMHGERARDGGFTLFDVPSLRDEPFEIAHDFEGKVERDVLAPSLTIAHFSDDVEFTSISAYVDWKISEEADFDFNPIDGVRRFTDEEQQYFSQEFRLNSALDGRGIEVSDDVNIHWLLGTQLFVSDSERSALNEFRPGGAGILFPPMNVGFDNATGEFDDYGIAIFGQATTSFFEKVDLTIGLRYDYEKKEADLFRTFDPGGFPIPLRDGEFDDSFSEFVPKVSLAWHVTDDVMLYGLVAKGFKAGGFNLDAPDDSIGFDQETSWTFEAGVKSSWLDNQLQVNASVFYIEWDDLQLSLFDPTAGGYITNAGEATSQGFELELLARPVEGLDLFAGIGLTDATFDRFRDQFGIDQSGNDLAFVPDVTWNAGAQYRGKINKHANWYVRGEYINIGDYSFDAGNLDGDRYSLLNLRLGFETANVRIEGWIRNALDDDYVLVAFQPNPGDPTLFVGEQGGPQTYGVTLSLKF